MAFSCECTGLRSVLGFIRSCTNVTLFNVIHFQFTVHKLAYLRVTGTLYLAQLIHVCQNDLHSNNLLGWMILCFYMYIYNKIKLFYHLIVQQRYRYNGDQRVHYPRPACHKYGGTEGQRVSTIFTAIS